MVVTKSPSVIVITKSVPTGTPVTEFPETVPPLTVIVPLISVKETLYVPFGFKIGCPAETFGTEPPVLGEVIQVAGIFKVKVVEQPTDCEAVILTTEPNGILII